MVFRRTLVLEPSWTNKMQSIFSLFDENGWSLPPNGEEGELINKACFVAAQTERIKGIGEPHFCLVDDHESHKFLRYHQKYTAGNRAIYPFLP